ncbi:MAG: YncE family protein [Exilispira sp.]
MKFRISKLSFFFLLIFLIALTSCVLTPSGSLYSTHDYLLILNSTGNVVLPYDITSNFQPDDPVAVGPSENTNYAPQQIILSDDENYIYIINSSDNSITKFTRNLYYLTRYALPAGSNPYNGFIEGSYMYISAYVSGTVIKLNLTTSAYIQSDSLYTQNNGIQAIANLNSDCLITINTNFNSSSFTYENSIIYILDKNTLSKIQEFELSSSFIGQPLKNFQQVYVHQQADGIYCDLIATGSYGISQDSGFLRIKLTKNGSQFLITKVSSDILPSGEYFGAISSVYNNYLYIISNKAIYKTAMNSSTVNFTSGIEKNSNVNGKENLSLIVVGETSSSSYIAIVDTPWGTPASFSIKPLISDFSSISFSNYMEFSGYPVGLIIRKGR